MPLSYASAASKTAAVPTHPVVSTNSVDAELYARRQAVELVNQAKEETEEVAKKLNAIGDTPNPAGETSSTEAVTTTTTTVVKEPTLCIARLPAQMSSDGVVMSVVGTDLGYGDIEKVDMIPKTDRNGVEYMMAFIHFTNWSDTDAVKSDRDKLMNGEKIKVVYDQENNRYFTLARSYTKTRQECHQERDGRNGKRENQFKPRKQHGGYSKPFVDADGWTTMPTYENKAKATHAAATHAVAAPSALVTPRSSGPNPHARDRTNNFTALDVDSD